MKKISCDKVQNILVHVEGKDTVVSSIMKSMDWKKLFDLVNING